MAYRSSNLMGDEIKLVPTVKEITKTKSLHPATSVNIVVFEGGVQGFMKATRFRLNFRTGDRV